MIPTREGRAAIREGREAYGARLNRALLIYPPRHCGVNPSRHLTCRKKYPSGTAVAAERTSPSGTVRNVVVAGTLGGFTTFFVA